MTTEQSFTVLIAGGGVAGLEAALALRELAGNRVRLQILAPNAEFTYRPMTVREPFAYAAASRYPLADIAADLDAELIVDELARVDATRRTAHTASGATLPYDALILALGARPRIAFAHAITIDDRRMDEQLHGIIQDVEGGYVRRLAFVAPARMGWPLPIYELALMTAQRAYSMGMDVAISVITPEQTPLAIFGDQASDAVGQALRDAGITYIASGDVGVQRSGHIVIHPGGPAIDVDRVIALPDLFGPSIRGLTVGDHGFIRVDRYGQVRDVARVYAAGDATDYPIKHGGIAAEQANAAARSIAALAGAQVTVKAFDPQIHAIVLTGGDPLYLTARIAGSHGLGSQVAARPSWAGGAKIAATHLASYLDRRNRAFAR